MTMSAATYPPMLSTPIPGAIPCFRLPEFEVDRLLPRRSQWDERCTAILEEFAASRSNNEIADLIAARTGKRFGMHAVSRRRTALGLHNGGPRRNDWTSPLRRWKRGRGCLTRKS